MPPIYHIWHDAILLFILILLLLFLHSLSLNVLVLFWISEAGAWDQQWKWRESREPSPWATFHFPSNSTSEHWNEIRVPQNQTLQTICHSRHVPSSTNCCKRVGHFLSSNFYMKRNHEHTYLLKRERERV